MKVYGTVLKHLGSIGFRQNEPRFNKRQCEMHLKAVLNNLLICMQLFHVADTLKEYLDSVFAMTVSILIFISRASTAFKSATIFVFINGLEQIVNDSKSINLPSKE